jgi:hypothetical protein
MVVVATLYVHIKVQNNRFWTLPSGKYKRNSEKYMFGLVSGYVKYQSGLKHLVLLHIS